MNLAELTEGDFRVFAAAIEAPDRPGFYAGVVVKPVRGGLPDGGQEAFRDERLEDGAVWSAAEDALAFALHVGVAAIHARRAWSVAFA
jgi:hypothetical protein